MLGPTPPGVAPCEVFTVGSGARYAYLGVPVSATIEEKCAALVSAHRELYDDGRRESEASAQPASHTAAVGVD
jgi:hypothetical protein